MCTAGCRGLSCKKLRSGSLCPAWVLAAQGGQRWGRDIGPLEEDRPGLEEVGKQSLLRISSEIPTFTGFGQRP